MAGILGTTLLNNSSFYFDMLEMKCLVLMVLLAQTSFVSPSMMNDFYTHDDNMTSLSRGIVVEIQNPSSEVLYHILAHPGFDVWSTGSAKAMISIENDKYILELKDIFPDVKVKVIQQVPRLVELDSQIRQREDVTNVTDTIKQLVILDEDISIDLIANISSVWFVNYHTYEDILLYLNLLHKAFPERTQLFSIGNTYEGNSIEGIRISADGFDKKKPEMIYNACQHAREWIR